MKRTDHQPVAYLFILPWIIGFLIFQLYPFVASFVYSFKMCIRDRFYRPFIGSVHSFRLAVAVPVLLPAPCIFPQLL